MPPRTKRNAINPRRHHSAAHPEHFHHDEPSPVAPDLLSFEPTLDAPPGAAYGAMTPAVFDPDPPPSDPELGRATTVIRDSHPDAQPVDYAKNVYDLDSDIDDGGPISPSTSPPGPSSFAIAHIPRSGLAQLAVAEDTTSDESSLSRSIGHTRSPVLAREPTTLETFSRTIRNYVPSSIPIPTAAPTPPRVSRPVSFGSFLTPSTHTTSPPARERNPEWKRRGSETSSQSERGSGPGAGEMPVFSLDDDIPEDGPREHERRVTRYPGVGDTEEVLWAGWDVLADAEVKSRSVLMLGYPRGLQIWDCSNLGSVSELLNLTGVQCGESSAGKAHVVAQQYISSRLCAGGE